MSLPRTQQGRDGLPAEVVARAPMPERWIEMARAEATQCAASAVLVDDRVNFRDESGSLRTQRRYSIAAGGEVLDHIHESVVPEILRAAVDDEVWPTRSAYLYYSRGDFQAPHQDIQQCQLTALMVLSSASSLQIFPGGLRGEPDKLVQKFYKDQLRVGVDLELPVGEVVVINGRLLPHARRPVESPLTTSVLCYGFANK